MRLLGGGLGRSCWGRRDDDGGHAGLKHVYYYTGSDDTMAFRDIDGWDRWGGRVLQSWGWKCSVRRNVRRNGLCLGQCN